MKNIKHKEAPIKSFPTLRGIFSLAYSRTFRKHWRTPKLTLLKGIFILTAVLCMPCIVSLAADKSQKNEPISLSFEITDCSSDKENGAIKAVVTNYDESAAYSISFNAGRTFNSMKKDTKTLIKAKSGFYKICVMKNGRKSTLSDIHTVYVGNDEKNYSIKAHTVSRGEQIYKDGNIRVVIENYDPKKSYEAIISGGKGGKKIVRMKKDSVNLVSLGAGKYKIRVKEKDSDKLRHSPEFTVDISKASHGQKKYIKTETILQNPELPSGCEVTSLAMLLNHMGYKADKEVLADKYLKKGKYRASDPRKVFVGNPRSVFAYGCYADVIETAAQKYISAHNGESKWKVRNLTGCSVDVLYNSLDRGCPVVTWVTADMKKPEDGKSWTIPDTKEKYTWTAGEHCVLLVGYNTKKGVVYVNDPLKGVTAYKKALFEKRFVQMGRNAVTIVRK